MKLKFMTTRQVNKDQHRLKEKIEKERLEKEAIKTAEGREYEEKEMEVKKNMTESLSSMFFLLQFVMSFYRNKRINM